MDELNENVDEQVNEEEIIKPLQGGEALSPYPQLPMLQKTLLAIIDRRGVINLSEPNIAGIVIMAAYVDLTREGVIALDDDTCTILAPLPAETPWLEFFYYAAAADENAGEFSRIVAVVGSRQYASALRAAVDAGFEPLVSAGLATALPQRGKATRYLPDQTTLRALITEVLEMLAGHVEVDADVLTFARLLQQGRRLRLFCGMQAANEAEAILKGIGERVDALDDEEYDLVADDEDIMISVAGALSLTTVVF